MEHEKKIVDYDSGEIKTVNANFIQFYSDHLPVVREMLVENSMALNLYFWLVERMDKKNALVVSHDALCEALNISRMSVHRSIKYLKEKKAIEVYKTGNSCIYYLNASIVWHDSADNKRFAIFDAKVYISESEQETFKTTLIGHAEKRKKRKKISSNSESFS